MSRQESQKSGKLGLERGGKYAHRGVVGEIAVEREVRARVYALPKKDKALQRIANGETRPVKKLALHHRKLKRMRLTYDEAHNVFIGPQVDDLKRLYGLLPPLTA